MHFMNISILFLAITVMYMHNVKAMPRDSTVIKTEAVSQIQDANSSKVKKPTVESVISIPGQVLCTYDKELEEPIENAVCQEHCIPKGYSYGVCVSGKCSCI